VEIKQSLRRLPALLQERRPRLLAALGFAGLLLLAAGNLLSGEEKSEAPPAAENSLTAAASEIEERLSAILSRIDGVGHAWVMVTLETSERAVYAVNGQSSDTVAETVAGTDSTRRETSSSSQQNYLLVGGSGDRSPLPLSREGARVRGAVVVCDGGGNAVVRANVIEAVTTALGITSDRVCVLRTE